MREMIFVVGRKHAARVRMIAMVCAVLLPVMALAFVPGVPGIALAAGVHLWARWRIAGCSLRRPSMSWACITASGEVVVGLHAA